MSGTALPDFDALWDYDHPDETETRFRELLPTAVESGNVSYHAQLMTQIARTQGLQRQFEAAHRTLDEAEKMLTEALSRDGENRGHAGRSGASPLQNPILGIQHSQLSTTRVRYLLERGRVYNSSGNPGQARPLFLQAYELARAASEDGYAVDAAHMMAIVEPPEEQINWNLKALELAENSAQPGARKWLASLYNNLGWTYHDEMKDYERALELFQKAVRYREEQGQPKTIRIAKWCVARAMRSLKRVNEALAMQRALMAELPAEEQDQNGYGQEEIGECLLALGQAEAARPHFARAYAALSQDEWLAEREPARIERLRVLGGG